MAQQPYWNPSDKDADITLSNSDRTASLASLAAGTVRSTVGVSSGKWYVELVRDALNGVYGIANSSHTVTNGNPGVDANSWGLLFASGNRRNNNSSVAYGSAVANGDVVMLAYDADNGRLWWGLNGSWFASGNPGAGTNAAYTGLSGTMYLLFGGGAGSGARVASLSVVASYSYSPPSGFTAGWGSSGPTVYDQALVASLSATASIRKTISKRLSAAASLAATLTKIAVFPVALVAGMTATATMRRQVHKGLSASLSLAATIRKTVGKGLSATLDYTATIAKAFPVHLSASLSSSASIAKTVAKNLSASLGLTAVLGKIKVAIVSMTATIPLTASISTIRLFFRSLAADLTLTASIRRTISKRLVALQPTLARPIAWIAYQFAAIRNDKPNWNQCPRCARKVRPNKLHQQMEYRGPRLVWTGLYVCSSCLDEPQQQGIWPRETGGDPKPVILARPRRD